MITYGENYGGGKIGDGITRKAGMEQPLHYWVPSIAPSGMAFLTSDRYGAAGRATCSWARSSSATSTASSSRTARSSARAQAAGRRQARIRDVKQGPDGLLYMLTDESNGKLIRLLPD